MGNLKACRCIFAFSHSVLAQWGRACLQAREVDRRADLQHAMVLEGGGCSPQASHAAHNGNPLLMEVAEGILARLQLPSTQKAEGRPRSSCNRCARSCGSTACATPRCYDTQKHTQRGRDRRSGLATSKSLVYAQFPLQPKPNSSLVADAITTLSGEHNNL
eukprot:226802-Amphidinium_carterae.1